MTVTFGLSKEGAARTKLRPTPGAEQRAVNTTRESDRCTIVIDRTIDEFTVVPDPRPFRLRLDQVSVLIPETE